MAKIAMIGAGSLVFCKTLMADFLATPALEGSEYRLMALTHRRLDKMHDFAERMIRDNGVKATVTATTDRREALKGADYVVVMIQVGGVDAFQHGLRDPHEVRGGQLHRRHDGPGRHLPRPAAHPGPAGDRARDAGSSAPTPSSSTTPTRWRCAAGRWERSTGCSSSASATACRPPWTSSPAMSGARRKRSTSLPPASTTWRGSSSWRRTGRTCTRSSGPTSRSRAIYVNEKVRGEVMRHFGYFMTESTGHLSEYLPYFRKNTKALELYCDEPGFGGETGAYYNYCAHDR